MKLSPRAWELLSLINDSTEWKDYVGGELALFYVPRPRGAWNKEPSGSGDARILRSLCNKGLTKNHPNTHTFAYSITEDGLLALQSRPE